MGSSMEVPDNIGRGTGLMEAWPGDVTWEEACPFQWLPQVGGWWATQIEAQDLGLASRLWAHGLPGNLEAHYERFSSLLPHFSPRLVRVPANPGASWYSQTAISCPGSSSLGWGEWGLSQAIYFLCFHAKTSAKTLMLLGEGY